MIRSIIQNTTTIILATIVVTLVLLLLQSSPFEIYITIYEGAYGSLEKLSRTLLITSIMCLSGLALVITFSTGLWNIGIEGQVLFGAIGATVIARTTMGETSIAPVFQLLTGASFGALLGLMCGILKTKANVHEIFGGLGLDFVAAGLIVYLVIGPWKREGIASTGGTDLFPQQSWMPTINNSNFPIGPLIIVLIVIVILYLLLNKTSIGLRLIATGSNKDATLRYKINSIKYICIAFLIAGAIAGLAGSIQAMSIHHKLVPNISGGYGFLGILIALIARRNLITVLIVSTVFASIMVGGIQLQLRLGLDSSFPYIIESVFVLSWLMIKASELDKLIVNSFIYRDRQ
jgi:ABC-type uncharacterized transport system permease subunit